MSLLMNWYQLFRSNNFFHFRDCPKSIILEKIDEKRSATKNEREFNDTVSKEYPSLPEIYKNIGRNEKCPCGSGLKFKKCHGK
jgi:preprotein translocase subunit SecA